MRAAASSIRFDVLDLVIGLPGPPGFKGSGGGALSGSELSHLRHVSIMLTVLFDATRGTYMGTELLPDSENEC